MAEFHAARGPGDKRRGLRTYSAEAAIVFWKTDGPFGGLSNMARGYPVRVGTHQSPTVEALYQALRFPSRPDLQLEVLQARNAWLAKRVARNHSAETRSDWMRIRVPVMRWCLRLKLGHALQKFGALLLETGELPIVERSARDPYWGALMQPRGELVGANVLGRLLMELRAHLQRDGAAAFQSVPAPDGIELTLLSNAVQAVSCSPTDGAMLQEAMSFPYGS